MILQQFYIDDIIKKAINEDINYIDAATDVLLCENNVINAQFVAKDDGVLAGIQVALRVFSLLDENTSTKHFKNDGDKIIKGEIIAEITGNTGVLLKGERTALNLLQHMSGIATATAAFVELCKGTNASVTDTRKTLPGLRALQKYSVIAGGGKNHRFNLSDGAMIKDNHIDVYGSIKAAVKTLREKTGHMLKIEVEVRNIKEVKEALNAGADVIMLDNMSIAEMREAVNLCNGRILIEASGNINKENIREVAETGVDLISIGSLTHSVKAFDISMKIKT